MARIKIINELNDVGIREAFDEFLEAKTASNLSSSTIKGYEYAFSVFWNYNEFDEESKCSEINQNLMNKFKNHLLKQDISKNSVNHYIKSLKSFLSWCFRMEYIQRFECDLVRAQETKIRYYTEEEMADLLEKPTGNNNFGAWRMWAIVCFCYATAARAQSICDVMVEDVDFYHKEIVFTHQKNNTLLTVPMSDTLEKVLKEYMRKFGINKMKWLFPEITGEQLTVNAIHKAIDRYCESRGVTKRGIHAVRHAYASQAIRNGMNPVKLQRIMNHSNFKTTERYLHLFGSDLKIDYNDVSPLDVASKKKSRTKKLG